MSLMIRIWKGENRPAMKKMVAIGAVLSAMLIGCEEQRGEPSCVPHSSVSAAARVTLAREATAPATRLEISATPCLGIPT